MVTQRGSSLPWKPRDFGSTLLSSQPMPAWWEYRPVSRAARVGLQRGVL